MPTINLMGLISRNDNATSIGSESLVYIAECDLSSGTAPTSFDWKKFPCVIKEILTMEPKTGELLDDRGRAVYNYSQPSKAKYAGNIFQRDANTFEFLRKSAGHTFIMWVVVGQIGNKQQEILMYGKLGCNYNEDMSAEPNIPIEFNCEINPVDIIADKPDNDCHAPSILLEANMMICKCDT